MTDMVIQPDVLSHLTEPMAQMYRVIPIAFKDDVLTVATCDPQKLSVVDELRSFLGYEIRPVVANEQEILAALDRFYGASGESVESLISDMEGDKDSARRPPSWNGPRLDRPDERRAGPRAPRSASC